jgi:hypothetical protein
MTTLLVTLALDPDHTDDVLDLLRSDVAPWLRRRPGFVTSRWLLGTTRDRCTVLVDVADAVADDAAHDLAGALGAGVDGGRSWHCERVEVVTDLHLADQPPISP